MLDYNVKLYNFIRDQIKDTKYIPNKEYVKGIFDSGEIHYGLKGYSQEEWQQAFTWAIADEYNGGCEVTT